MTYLSIIPAASCFECVTWWEVVHYLLKCGMADREQETVTAEFLLVFRLFRAGDSGSRVDSRCYYHLPKTVWALELISCVSSCASVKKSHLQTSVMKPKNILYSVNTSLTERRQCCCFHNIAANCPGDKFRKTCEQSVLVHTQIAGKGDNLRTCRY